MTQRSKTRTGLSLGGMVVKWREAVRVVEHGGEVALVELDPSFAERVAGELGLEAGGDRRRIAVRGKSEWVELIALEGAPVLVAVHVSEEDGTVAVTALPAEEAARLDEPVYDEYGECLNVDWIYDRKVLLLSL